MKVSIIVPVYNAEKYLKRCIRSIENQTYKNWELILIDDGSVDLSPQIIDSAAQKDRRIKVFHQDNLGPGAARNIGISMAEGEYIIFVDSDDYIDKDYLKMLVPKAKKSDVIFIDALQVKNDGEILKEEKMSIYKKWDKEKILRSQLTGKISWGGWRKAVRATILKENNIQYSMHSIGEELIYSFQILNLASKIDFLDDKPVYYYVNHEGSQSKKEISDPWGEALIELKKFMVTHELYEEYANTINAFNITATIVSIDKIAKMYKRKICRNQAKLRMKKFRRSYDQERHLDWNSLSYKAKIFVPFMKMNLYYPILLCCKIKNILKND